MEAPFKSQRILAQVTGSPGLTQDWVNGSMSDIGIFRQLPIGALFEPRATIPSRSISATRKQVATGSSILRGQLLRYSLLVPNAGNKNRTKPKTLVQSVVSQLQKERTRLEDELHRVTATSASRCLASAASTRAASSGLGTLHST
jgi:hypothetical protein